MAHTLYNIVIFLYGFSIRIAALFNPKAKKFTQGRKGLFKRLHDQFRNNPQPVVWFHCASLGEFEQGRPVIEALREYSSHYRVLLTFFSPSGYEVRKNYAGADEVFYLPLDTPSNAKHFVEIVNPILAVFVKYEFWYNYFDELHQRNIPLLSIAAIFRKEQFIFSRSGRFLLQALNKTQHLFTQNDSSLLLLKQHGIDQATVAGDTRFDRVYALKNQQIDLPVMEKFKGHEPLMVIGSSWKEDMEILLPLINEGFGNLKYVIAPHELTAGSIRAIEEGLQQPFIKYSETDEKDITKARVLIIDNMGLLSKLYRYGEYAYIGGAFGDGLHNTLEAATFGLPVFFGNKNYRKFNEAKELISLGGAFPIGSSDQLRNTLQPLLNSGKRDNLGQKVADYVKQNTGATDSIMAYIKHILPAT
ncbi:MAG: 3-deoxy-D-manno-octulosonic acid transferase [Cyclobacteriaceae bacterium]|nr:3-deoxy-D-manno-octulosonic acid transferase [Cyclobacteriaceae bacterium]